MLAELHNEAMLVSTENDIQCGLGGWADCTVLFVFFVNVPAGLRKGTQTQTPGEC